MNEAERINACASESPAGAVEIMQKKDKMASILTPDWVGIECIRSLFIQKYWATASARFTTTFVNNPFGHKCAVCDRLWFLRSLKPTKGNTYRS
ncbi:uncharacterized protein TNCT_278191 [Trichonephila clavata]|uniref:Uncharacterized protein n=1 Tax=Trichonephila clavata TaxID=2740835 RepID=A0A8X6H404_TRICU|nr:uncharacterized protein TNCT_278191 [Trichonephila clavata]